MEVSREEAGVSESEELILAEDEGFSRFISSSVRSSLTFFPALVCILCGSDDKLQNASNPLIVLKRRQISLRF